MSSHTGIAAYSDAFQRDGFAIVPRLISPERARAVKAEIASILDAVRSSAVASGQPSPVRGGIYVGLSAHPLGERCRDLVRDPCILDLLAAAYAPDIEFMSDKVALKSDETGFGTPWHQDWPYWHGSHKVSVWVALDDATVANGCMKLLPGSHRAALSHDGEAPDAAVFGRRLRPGEVDEALAVTAAVPAGGAVLFHDLALHASHPNTSGEDRWAWIGTYRDALADDPEYTWAVAREVVRGRRRD